MIPDSYQPASWRGVLPRCPETGDLAFSLDLAAGETVRVRLSGEDAGRFLSALNGSFGTVSPITPRDLVGEPYPSLGVDFQGEVATPYGKFQRLEVGPNWHVATRADLLFAILGFSEPFLEPGWKAVAILEHSDKGLVVLRGAIPGDADLHVPKAEPPSVVSQSASEWDDFRKAHIKFLRANAEVYLEKARRMEAGSEWGDDDAGPGVFPAEFALGALRGVLNPCPDTGERAFVLDMAAGGALRLRISSEDARKLSETLQSSHGSRSHSETDSGIPSLDGSTPPGSEGP